MKNQQTLRLLKSDIPFQESTYMTREGWKAEKPKHLWKEANFVAFQPEDINTLINHYRKIVVGLSPLFSSQMKQIQRHEQKDKNDLSYHFYIHSSGKIYEGRALNIQAEVLNEGDNAHTIFIALVIEKIGEEFSLTESCYDASHALIKALQRKMRENILYLEGESEMKNYKSHPFPKGNSFVFMDRLRADTRLKKSMEVASPLEGNIHIYFFDVADRPAPTGYSYTEDENEYNAKTFRASVYVVKQEGLANTSVEGPFIGSTFVSYESDGSPKLRLNGTSSRTLKEGKHDFVGTFAHNASTERGLNIVKKGSRKGISGYEHTEDYEYKGKEVSDLAEVNIHSAINPSQAKIMIGIAPNRVPKYIIGFHGGIACLIIRFDQAERFFNLFKWVHEGGKYSSLDSGSVTVVRESDSKSLNEFNQKYKLTPNPVSNNNTFINKAPQPPEERSFESEQKYQLKWKSDNSHKESSDIIVNEIAQKMKSNAEKTVILRIFVIKSLKYSESTSIKERDNIKKSLLAKGISESRISYDNQIATNILQTDLIELEILKPKQN